jgi:hypothetical protein
MEAFDLFIVFDDLRETCLFKHVSVLNHPLLHDGLTALELRRSALAVRRPFLPDGRGAWYATRTFFVTVTVSAGNIYRERCIKCQHLYERNYYVMDDAVGC